MPPKQELMLGMVVFLEAVLPCRSHSIRILNNPRRTVTILTRSPSPNCLGKESTTEQKWRRRLKVRPCTKTSTERSLMLHEVMIPWIAIRASDDFGLRILGGSFCGRINVK